MSFFASKAVVVGSSPTATRSAVYTVSNIDERNMLLELRDGSLCYVKDATKDNTVESGYAIYIYDSSTWNKISDEHMVRNTYRYDTVVQN